jgi:O-antigen/teichoic acid export membrane protein
MTVVISATMPLQGMLSGTTSARRDFAWTLAGNLVYAGCQWGMVMALAKLSTATAVGQFALGLAVTAPIFLFSNLNLRAVLATDTGDEFPFRAYLRLRLLTTAGALGLALAIVLAGGYRHETAAFIALVALAKTVESVSDVYYGLCQLQRRMRRIAISMMLRGVFSLALLAGILALGGTPVEAVASMGAVWLAVLVGYDMRSAGPLHSSGRAASRSGMLSRMAKVSFPLGLTAMLLSFNANIPRYLLDHSRSERDLGIYSALAFFVLAGGTVVNAMCQSVMTQLAHSYRQGRREDFCRVLMRLAGLATAMGTLGLGLSAVAGREMLLMLYRTEYAQHAAILTLLMFGGMVQYCGSCFGTAVTAMRMFHVQMRIHAIASVLTLVCAWPLIHRWGMAGAAWASVIGSACATVPYAVLTWKKMKEWS